MKPSGADYAMLALSPIIEAKFAEVCGHSKWSKSGEMDPDTMEMINAKCPCGATKTWPVNQKEKSRVIAERKKRETAAREFGRAVGESMNRVILDILKQGS